MTGGDARLRITMRILFTPVRVEESDYSAAR